MKFIFNIIKKRKKRLKSIKKSKTQKTINYKKRKSD